MKIIDLPIEIIRIFRDYLYQINEFPFGVQEIEDDDGGIEFCQYYENRISWRSFLSVSKQSEWNQIRRRLMIYNLNDFHSKRFLAEPEFRDIVLLKMDDCSQQLTLLYEEESGSFRPYNYEFLSSLKMKLFYYKGDNFRFLNDLKRNSHFPISINIVSEGQLSHYQNLFKSSLSMMPTAQCSCEVRNVTGLKITFYHEINYNSFSNLRSLHLHQINHIFEDFYPIFNLNLLFLKELYISYLNVDKLQLKLPVLTRLVLDSVHFKNFELQLPELKLVTFTFISCYKYIKEFYKYIIRCETLYSIEITGKIFYSELQALLNKYTKLHLWCCELKDSQLPELPELLIGPQVKTIYMSVRNKLPIHWGSLEPIVYAGLPTKLFFKRKYSLLPSTPADIYKFLQELTLTYLSEFDVSLCRQIPYLTFNDCRYLFNLKTLGKYQKYLNLRHTNVRNKHLRHYSKVFFLNISECEYITNIRSLKKNKILLADDLTLSSTEINEEDCRTVSMKSKEKIDIYVFGCIHRMVVSPETEVTVVPPSGCVLHRVDKNE